MNLNTRPNDERMGKHNIRAYAMVEGTLYSICSTITGKN